jgi:hypothetical protein
MHTTFGIEGVEPAVMLLRGESGATLKGPDLNPTARS